VGGATDRSTDVLIIGAGPTGLVLALWLTHLGVRVTIIDRTAQPGTTSRAIAVQARTLELYRQIDLAKPVVERGRRAVAANVWVAGNKRAHIVFGELGANVSPFPYALIFPQDEHERLLTDRLAALGIEVEHGTELLDFDEAGGSIHARLKRADGSTGACDARYLAGCDGAHSSVREKLQLGFEGGTYSHLFYVADAQASGAAMNGEVHVALDRADFLAIFPLKADGHARLVGTVRDTAPRPQQDLSWDDVSERVIGWMGIHVERINWFSTYRVHHRVAERFRSGAVFLLGDAAHVHSPVGGQGMNTGIGDAINLAWKLAAVLHARASPSLLDSYEPERIAFARRLVATTDQVFTAITSPGTIARVLRLRIVPTLLSLAARFAALRGFVFRTVSQISLNYRQSSLSQGRSGAVHGGDRLPWVPGSGNEDNFSPLVSLDWQAHVYGEPSPALQTLCEARQLPLHVFAWRAQMRRCGLQRNALYLVRPDGYVALADDRARASVLADYLDTRKLVPMMKSALP
jgi:2-polyprenyl-6-methoxyphenol hydroxylase-like FAD-dependent oxidoreductase